MKKKMAKICLLILLVVFCASILMACAGESAYEIAVRNGFEGTEQEWLESLKGDKGDVGEVGETGAAGLTPTIGENGNWFIGETDTGVKVHPEENLSLTLDEGGNWLIGTHYAGITVEDTTNIAYTQFKNKLSGIVAISVLNSEQSFDRVVYSIYRRSAATEELVTNDYILKDVELNGNSEIIQITAPYFGNYLVEVSYLNGQAVVAKVTSDCVKVKADHYNFVYSNSTLPVLYSATEIAKLDHTYPTYIAINRNSTFDWNSLPQNCYPVPNTVINTKSTNLALFDEAGNQKTCTYGAWTNGAWGALYDNSSTVTPVLRHMKNWIADLYAMDANSTFTFYIDDIIAEVGLWWTYGNNFPDDAFTINMYTEGSASANYFKQYGYNTYATFKTRQSAYNSHIADLKNGQDITSIWNVPHFIAMATDSNVNYCVNIKNSMIGMLSPTEEGYSEYKALLEQNITNLSIGEALQSVEAAGKMRDLEFMLRTRWIDNKGEEGNANQYFANDNGKKNLLIIGTSVNGENNSNGCGANTTLMTFLPKILELYGNEYNIFYKGHPSYTINAFKDGRAAYFANNNIVVLPNAVPAETYMYLYNEVYIGGYHSSTMSSSMVGQTLFFLGTEARIVAQTSTAAMFDRTDSNYLGVFENTVFVSYDADTSQVVVKGLGA